MDIRKWLKKKSAEESTTSDTKQSREEMETMWVTPEQLTLLRLLSTSAYLELINTHLLLNVNHTGIDKNELIMVK